MKKKKKHREKIKMKNISIRKFLWRETDILKYKLNSWFISELYLQEYKKKKKMKKKKKRKRKKAK